MKNTVKIILIASIVTFTLAACRKAGPGGKVKVAAFPKHHNKSIPGAMVYIKYGTKNFPGEDVSKYDDKGMAEVMPGEDPHVHFEDLRKGDYYLYSVGYDSSIARPVKGGVSFTISKKDGEMDVDVPVTE